MRIFIATFGTETSTFASFPTGLDDFKHHAWAEHGAEGAVPSHWNAPARTWLARARALGWDVVEGLHTFAEPAGITTRATYEYLRDRILGELAAAGPVDAVLLFLHGAMVAEGYDDCEGDFVTRVRQLVGPDVTIGLELDLHAHIDHVLVETADIIVFYKAYPHNDQAARADDVFTLVERTLAGEIDPKMALFDCRTMGLFPTTMQGPMIGFTEAMFDAEGKDGILSLSLNHGFPWADVPIAGAKMLAIADGSMALAERTAEAFGKRFYRDRKAACLPFTSFEDAIAEARIAGEKPLLLADTSDQAGSGAPGDTTYMLRAFIDSGIRNAAIVPLFDPLAVGICQQVGVGAKLRLRIGGKFEPHSGPPCDGEAEVLFLKRDAYQEQENGGELHCGDIAVVRMEGIEILLTTKRVNVYSLSMFERHGISLGDKQIVAIKNLYKHTDLFAPLVRRQLYVASPGASDPDWAALDWKRLPRPIWPLDADPLGLDG
ncbi:Microcystin degradation protein MlrC, contains DUF1485 domain [Devosia enhydra]|uniref:Microcystinase C n=1 Tax=Devosia enhydra TaxID=665118 RepID=A0A1K2I1G1_9HYPH|nr:M81 family metallopeptidase [Devosia enhydra]SFZ86051.1 Microcystin degradation protein MlrC, contains DUF1485 domain [Devosia enhydra]